MKVDVDLWMLGQFRYLITVEQSDSRTAEEGAQSTASASPSLQANASTCSAEFASSMYFQPDKITSSMIPDDHSNARLSRRFRVSPICIDFNPITLWRLPGVLGRHAFPCWICHSYHWLLAFFVSYISMTNRGQCRPII